MNCKPLAALAAAAVLAQTPSNVKIDSPQARVLIATEQPHHPSALHEHKVNRVMVYLGDGEMRYTNGAGKTETKSYKAGEVRWTPAEPPHTSENITDHAFQIAEVELKNNPQPGSVTSALDPLKVDPKHYKLEFENDQVRVLRVRFGPHEKGVQHEHKLNHIVVYLTDQAKGKAGEVKLDPPMAHTEENPLDHAVERIAIDLK
jgi:quercetin dioxygenase-like cupin family protein